MRRKNRVTIETSIIFWIILLMIIGLGCTVFASIGVELKYWGNTVEKVLSAIGTTLLSAGCVSLIVEVSSMKSMVQTAFKDILDCNFPLNAYSSEKLEKLNNAIAAKRVNIEVESIEKSIYKMEPKLLEYATGLYYEYYTANYTIRPCEEEGYLRKSVTLKYEVINKHKKPNIIQHSVLLYNMHENMSDEEKRKRFRVTKFLINSTDLSSEVSNYIRYENVEKKKHSTYNYRAIIRRELQECERHKVFLEFEYEVPINDLNQIFKITKACKRLEHTITLEENKRNKCNWRVSANAFTSFYCNESDDDNGFSVEQHSDSLVKIDFRDWIIPGAGYVVNIYRTNEE